MEKQVPKSRFEARVLEYFHEVERTGRTLVITDRDRPVLQLSPYRNDPEEVLAELRGSVKHFDNSMEPVGVEDWEVLG